MTGAILTLTLTRWLVPAEAAADGETLWIAGLWFLLGGLCGLIFQNNRRCDLADLAVALLIAGHVLSGMMVVFSDGDRRAAVNLIWEWLSLGVFWCAWRGALRCVAVRRSVLPLMLVTAVTLSLWGLWQYFVWYPQIQSRLGPLFDQLKQLENHGGDAAAVRKQLAEAGVPVAGPALRLFEDRLRNSREPFGPFALANTLGGLLAAWIVIAVGALLLRDDSQKRSAATRAGSGMIMICLVPIAACVYLTNSRTAWGGLLAAGLVACAVSLARKSSSPRWKTWLFPAVTLLALAAAAAGILWIMQDVRRVPGPVKSLAYRVEYWIGTGKLLATTPWRGVGLGQFRDRYLAFKVPGSSEEIADPHNLFLDVWANGGIISLAGLVLLLILTWLSLWRHCTNTLPTTLAVSPPPASPNRAWILAGALAFISTASWQLVSTGLWDEQVDRLLVVAIVWLSVSGLLSAMHKSELRCPPDIALFAAVALTVHLLGAGGIAMPAVTQLWLLLLAWAWTPAQPAAGEAPRSLSTPMLLSCAVCLALFAACVGTGCRPVAMRQRLMANGDYDWITRNDFDRAERDYRQAAEADPLSAEPWQRLAQLEFLRATATGPKLDRPRFDASLSDEREAIRRSPHRPAYRIELAEMLADAAKRTRLQADWEAAAEAYRETLPGHPFSIALLSGFAVALSHAGPPDEAADMARRALRQDELNHARGHSDRFLPDAAVRELRAISEPAAKP